MYDIALVFCTYGSIQSETVLALNRLRHQSDVRWAFQLRSGDALISRSRSIEASKFLRGQGAPYMLFIDEDIIFTPEDVRKILAALQQGYPVVGGMYPTGDGSRLAHSWSGPLPVDGKVHEIEYVSTGFMGISRAVLEQVRDKLELPRLHQGHWADCWPFFEAGRTRFPENVVRGMYLSEDWDFCEKVRVAGAKVYLHTGVSLGHKKTTVYVAQDAVSGSKAPEFGFNIWEDVEQFTGKQRGEVWAKSWREVLAEEFAAKAGTDFDFYKDTKNYLFDLAVFNSQAGYQNGKIAALRGMANKNVLDIGSGIGTLAMWLARDNHKVVGYEINDYNRTFSNWRKNKYGLHNLTFMEELPDDLQEFDYVLAVDVFEHVEDLEAFILGLGKKLRVGAKLYHVDSFKDEYALHTDHSDKIDEFLTKAGFMVWDHVWAMKVKEV